MDEVVITIDGWRLNRFFTFVVIMDAVQIENLSFKYKDQSSLIEALSLQIGKGERFGIFGPNGAGKTTLMSLITGLLPYQQGSIKISGKELTGHKDDVKK
ncbi:ATP-binding cassette domain-containing protein [Niabella sp. W65]|nr:ATP-binding cassette domain-containing protein [Niabella sp. W65]MCH7368782.1 ATP-binding cassette domain-containing protein [Niabella sp. W65]